MLRAKAHTFGNVLQAVVNPGLCEVGLSEHLLVVQLLELHEQLVHHLQRLRGILLLLQQARQLFSVHSVNVDDIGSQKGNVS